MLYSDINNIKAFQLFNKTCKNNENRSCYIPILNEKNNPQLVCFYRNSTILNNINAYISLVIIFYHNYASPQNENRRKIHIISRVKYN